MLAPGSRRILTSSRHVGPYRAGFFGSGRSGWPDTPRHGEKTSQNRHAKMRPARASKLQFRAVLTLGLLGRSARRLRSRVAKVRWLVLATVPVCFLLPGCPLSDNYTIRGASAGSGPLAIAGSASLLSAAGTFSTAGRAQAGDAAGDDAAAGVGSGAGSTDGGGPGAGGTGAAGAAGNGVGSAAGSGGAGSAGAGGTGASAGMGGTAAGAGGATNGGSSSGGAAGVAGSSSTLPSPACADGVSKGSSCTAGLPSCYKSCGPNNLGYKRETCVGGVYDELMDGCTFPAGQDYSCYKVAPSLPAECPVATVPRAGRLCQIASCIVCFGGNALAPQYQDSNGMQKEGYCVCSDAGSWTCASSPSSWPCKAGPSCTPPPGPGQLSTPR